MGISVATAEQLGSADRSRGARDRIFYGAGAWFCAATVFAGFSPTFFLAPLLSRPLPRPLLIAHGVLLTAWFAIYVAQTVLVARGRTPTHRRLGRVGGVLTIPVLGVLAAVLFTAVRRDTATAPVEALTLGLISNTLLVATVVTAIGLALWQRRNSAAHKRLMWSGAILLQVAGLGRLVALLGIPWATLPIMIALAVSNAIYDVVTMRRVHWASVCGAVLVLAPISIGPLGGALARVPFVQDIAVALFR